MFEKKVVNGLKKRRFSLLKLIFILATVWAIIIFCIIGNCSCAPAVQFRKGDYGITRLPDGYDVPEGYIEIGSINYEPGILAINCGENIMISEIEMICIKNKADAYRLFNIKKPDWSNTCWRTEALILRKN